MVCYNLALRTFKSLVCYLLVISIGIFHKWRHKFLLCYWSKIICFLEKQSNCDVIWGWAQCVKYCSHQPHHSLGAIKSENLWMVRLEWRHNILLLWTHWQRLQRSISSTFCDQLLCQYVDLLWPVWRIA